MMNYSTLKKTAAFTLAIAFALIANAQDKPSATTSSAKVFGGRAQYRTWTVGINAGFTAPAVLTGGSNDFNKGVKFGEYTFKPYYGINLRKQLAHSFGLQGDFQMGKVQGYNKNGALSTGVNGSLSKNLVSVNAFETKVGYDLSLSGVVNVATIDFINRENKVNFYVSAGYGLMGYAAKGYSKYSTNAVVYDFKGKSGSSLNKTYVKQGYIPVGLGIKFKLGDRVALDLGYTMKFIDADNFDGLYTVDNRANDKFSYTHAGLEFSLGSAAKPDLNWVNPVAMMYDELKDPTLRQEVEALKGRVSNLEQSVQDLKKDTDGDGVADQFDKCPNTPAGAKVDGAGCELDTDGDGIPDWKDKCPTEKGTVALNGCPEVDNSNMLKDVSTIQFEFNSSVLRTSSYPTLDKVSSLLRAKSTLMLQLDGHASAEGTDAYNMQLSIDRANAVKTYLVNSGVDAKNIASKGYGETRPIASNATEEGRVANRRVEFRQQ